MKKGILGLLIGILFVFVSWEALEFFQGLTGFFKMPAVFVFEVTAFLGLGAVLTFAVLKMKRTPAWLGFKEKYLSVPRMYSVWTGSAWRPFRTQHRP